MRRRPWISGLAIAAALLLGACGSDESGEASETGDGEAVTAFIGQVDQVCVDYAIAVNEISDRLGVPQGFADTAAYDQEQASAAYDQAEAAGPLGPPTAIADEYEAFTGNLFAYADAYQESADNSAAGNESAWEASEDARGEVGTDLIDSADALGLQACARKLPAPEEAAVQEVTERVLTGADPEGSCADDLTGNFLEILGGERGCVRELRGLANEGVAPEFLYFTGVEDVLASANVNYASTAGAAQQYLIYDFVWDEDGERWLMDSSFVVGPAEPAPSTGSGGSA